MAEAGSSRYNPIYIGSKEQQVAEAKARVEAAIKAGTMTEEMRPFVNMLEQVKKSDKDNKFYCASTTPYMAVDGRVAAAAKSATPTSILTWFNTTPETMQIVFEDLVLTIPPMHALALAVERYDTGTVRRYATGTEAIRVNGSGADKTHHIANAETSAIGRALGSLGYGLIPGSGLTTAEVMKQVNEDEARGEAPAPSNRRRSGGSRRRTADPKEETKAEPKPEPKPEAAADEGQPEPPAEDAAEVEQAEAKAESKKGGLSKAAVVTGVKARVKQLDELGWEGANKFSVIKHVSKTEECGEFETLADLYAKGTVDQLVAVGRYVAGKIEEAKAAMAEAKAA
jgi:hypothetical protein